MRMILHSPRRSSTTHKNNANNEPHHTQSQQDGNDDTIDNDTNDVDSESSIQEQPPIATEEDVEPWVDWIKRCTRSAEEHMRNLGLDDWITIQRRREWRWARTVATNAQEKWSLKAIAWAPQLDARLCPNRRQGRPVTRWRDDIDQHIHESSSGNSNEMSSWIATAQNKEIWNDLEESYVRCNYHN